MQRTQSIRRLLLVGAKGVSQQVHARFHIVVARIPNLAAFAVPVFFGALPVDVFAFGGHNDGALRIKKGLNPGDSHVSFDHIWAHFQKFMHSFLHATVVSSLGNGNGSVDDEKDGVRSIHTQRVILQEVGRSTQHCQSKHGDRMTFSVSLHTAIHCPASRSINQSALTCTVPPWHLRWPPPRREHRPTPE